MKRIQLPNEVHGGILVAMLAGVVGFTSGALVTNSVLVFAVGLVLTFMLALLAQVLINMGIAKLLDAEENARKRSSDDA